MLDWKDFNFMIMEIEKAYVNDKSSLSKADKQYLKTVDCWLDDLPYCSYDNWCILNESVISHIQTIYSRTIKDN